MVVTALLTKNAKVDSVLLTLAHLCVRQLKLVDNIQMDAIVHLVMNANQHIVLLLILVNQSANLKDKHQAHMLMAVNALKTMSVLLEYATQMLAHLIALKLLLLENILMDANVL